MLYVIEFRKVLTPKTLIVYIDESSINRHIKKNYSWSNKGSSVEALNSSYTGSTSIWMAIWSNGTWTAMLTDETINSEKFIKFIDHFECWLRLNSYFEEYNILLLLDNWSIHKTSKVKEKLLEANITVLYLSWYTPQWAPVEWCFAIMKNALRNRKSESMINLSLKKNYSVIHNCLRLITANTIKKIFSKMIKDIRIKTND